MAGCWGLQSAVPDSIDSLCEAFPPTQEGFPKVGGMMGWVLAWGYGGSYADPRWPR
eukprot:COSAG01_NODE_8684_length_2697_cov_8.200154_1_plen_56_part_00